MYSGFRGFLGNHNVYKDEKNATVVIFADIYVYGSAASYSMAVNIAADMAFHWNLSHPVITLNNKRYKLRFDIQGHDRLVTREMVVHNQDYKNLFIIVTKRDYGAAYFGITANTDA